MFKGDLWGGGGERGYGEASKNKLKDSNFNFPMTCHLLKHILYTWKNSLRKSLWILNILAFLLFENGNTFILSLVYMVQSIKMYNEGVVVEKASFQGFVNDESL